MIGISAWASPLNLAIKLPTKLQQLQEYYRAEVIIHVQMTLQSLFRRH